MRMIVLRCLALLAVAVPWLLPVSAEVINLEPDLLRPQEAFNLTGVMADDEIKFAINIAPGYYLYRDRTRVSVLAGGASFASLDLPAGNLRVDDFFGEVVTWRDTVTVTAPVVRHGATGDILVEVVTQGCADYGVCYPPYPVTLAFSLAGGAGELVAPVADRVVETFSKPVDNTSVLREILAGGSIWLIAFTFFNAGLLLAFTPCVLPMVPIVLAVTTKGTRLGGGRALALGGTYVAGMAVIYTALGVLTASSGTLLVGALQTPLIVIPLALMFAVLGLVVVFGINLRLLPAGLQSRLTAARGKPGTFPSALLAGAVSAVVVSPCVAAPLVGALLFIAATGDTSVGALALFSLALGMGVLPLACAAGAGSLLPRAGPFSEAVRLLFGYLLLAVAVWVTGGIIPAAYKMIAYGVLALLALLPFAKAALGAGTLMRSGAAFASVLLLSLAGVMLVGGFTGGTNELAPLVHLGNKSERVEFAMTVTTEAQYRDAYADFHPQGTVEYYTAQWCISCREIDGYTFTDPEVVTALAKYRRIKVDLTSNNDDSRRLLAMHNLFGPPAIVVRGVDGRQLLRLAGYIEREQLLAALAQLN